MTYPCNHRGGLRYSEIKHMGKRERDEAKKGRYFYEDGKERVVERQRNAYVSAALI